MTSETGICCKNVENRHLLPRIGCQATPLDSVLITDGYVWFDIVVNRVFVAHIGERTSFRE